MPVQEFVGKVVSNRMMKSVLVAVQYVKTIPKYNKDVRKTSKLMAHDAKNECNPGDIVRIRSCRPLSKHKAFEVSEIVKKELIFESPAAKAARATPAK
mmetsp:Transcript_20561/g.66709  ORF Transcript_20561/g.66709 Transcript_20561/m.66709 type:complete len:98 (-) Transcript_20561:67-360(-)|eukprot:CAMPEP_0170133246 /NCGR_PEP_ID=MMETSP0033_2-20121228/1167_1 /TAXON_ID=195969 /ORGANISM="Dolichomastix tenuilepis, Strain CCMP3274" /LENGTH=97 /DNA_ID=CAMNT_0010368713 /DNA_START=150 /DNA_END=443 /DNA_ORIENTATION=+